jgi:hypothetical protein
VNEADVITVAASTDPGLWGVLLEAAAGSPEAVAILIVGWHLRGHLEAIEALLRELRWAVLRRDGPPPPGVRVVGGDDA